MVSSRHGYLLVAATVMAATGCSPQKPTDSGPPKKVAETLVTSGGPTTPTGEVPVDVRVSAAARSQLLKIGQMREVKKFWVRLEFTPEGCQGMKTHLAMDADAPGPTDTESQDGDIAYSYPREQSFLVQGALVDWDAEKDGFRVTFPTKTQHNKDRTSRWIEDEFQKKVKALPPAGEGAGE